MLIGILLPALNKARESARQAKCLNNMRQISIATISFAQETPRAGCSAGPATGSIPYNPQTGRAPFGGGTAATSAPPGNWIAWERRIDPDHRREHSERCADQNITYSALAPLHERQAEVHTTPAEANTISAKLEEVFRCPSDNLLTAHPNHGQQGVPLQLQHERPVPDPVSRRHVTD